MTGIAAEDPLREKRPRGQAGGGSPILSQFCRMSEFQSEPERSDPARSLAGHACRLPITPACLAAFPLLIPPPPFLLTVLYSLLSIFFPLPN
jgi:hypothetical protein